MRFKLDYITNSSSSSFLVVFDKLPETVTEMRELLFADRMEFQNPYNDELFWSTDEIAEIVLGDTHEARLDELSGFFEERSSNDVELDEFSLPEHRFDWEGYRKAVNAKARESLARFLSRHSGKYFCVYEYSDNDGSLGSAMEHGNIFRRLEHIRLSKH